MTVRELLTAKGSQEIIAMESGRTVEDANGKMSEHSVSALLVTEGGRTVGIFTERDVVRSYLVMKKRPFDTIPLRDAMTRDIMVAEEEDDIDSIMSIMIEKSRYINPLPGNLGEILAGFERVLVPEINNGQLIKVLGEKYLVPAEGFNMIRGLPLRTEEIEEAIESRLGGNHA